MPPRAADGTLERTLTDATQGPPDIVGIIDSGSASSRPFVRLPCLLVRLRIALTFTGHVYFYVYMLYSFAFAFAFAFRVTLNSYFDSYCAR